MKKVVLLGIVTVLIICAWYLFLKPFEFEVNFKAKTLPGDVIQTIRIWDKSRSDLEVQSVDSVFELHQKVTVNNRTYLYEWKFENIHDSLTNVQIGITQPSRKILNKILIPVTEQAIEVDANQIAHEFYKILREHLRITKVEVQGERESPSSFCVCRSMTTAQTEKANGMMKDYEVLTSFISTFNLKPNGPPIVEIKEWSHGGNSLKFDFCFPVEEAKFLPVSSSVVYKEMKGRKALKAVYNGNYITSDRAWYALLAFANRNGYKVAGSPIEVFHNNPNLGLSEEKWKADIYLPIY
jgi:hypothetical protein